MVKWSKTRWCKTVRTYFWELQFCYLQVDAFFDKIVLALIWPIYYWDSYSYQWQWYVYHLTFSSKHRTHFPKNAKRNTIQVLSYNLGHFISKTLNSESKLSLFGKLYIIWCCVFVEDHIEIVPEVTVRCVSTSGEHLVEGENWALDSCTQCVCHGGELLCEIESCPPVLCHHPVLLPGKCCPVCPGTTTHLTQQTRHVESMLV